MATAVHIPLAEYLATTYRPDCEYIDGEVKERNVGKWDHARVILLLGGWFMMREAEWNILSSTDQRLQVAPDRVRIPDLVVLRPGTQQQVLTEPPLLVVEVLSPDDSYSDLEERCRDYQAMGVEHLWIIDPKTRTGRMCLGRQWLASERLEVPGTPIFVSLERLFSDLYRHAQL